jgi:hypothetical protein
LEDLVSAPIALDVERSAARYRMSDRKKSRQARKQTRAELPPNSIVRQWRIAVVAFVVLFALVWLLFAILESGQAQVP